MRKSSYWLSIMSNPLSQNVIVDYDMNVIPYPHPITAADKLRIVTDTPQETQTAQTQTALDAPMLPQGTIVTDDVSGNVVVIAPVLPTPSENLTDLLVDWDPAGLQFQKAHDGTFIRFFFYEGLWRAASTLSLELDKVNQKLGHSKSFYQMINEALDLNTQVLDRSLVYFFILEHPDNVAIVHHQVPTLQLVASVQVLQTAPFYKVNKLNGVLSYVPTLPSSPTINTTATTATTVAEAASTTVTLSKPVTEVGFIINKSLPDGSLMRWRANTPEYAAAKELKGTGSRGTDKRFRLLEILCGKTDNNVVETKLREFISVFPCYIPILKTLDDELAQLFKIVFTFYVMQFIHSENDLVSPGFVRFLNRVQKEVYFQKLKPIGARMDQESITSFLLAQNPAQVMFLLNQMKEMQKTYTPTELATIDTYLETPRTSKTRK